MPLERKWRTGVAIVLTLLAARGVLGSALWDIEIVEAAGAREKAPAGGAFTAGHQD